MSLFLAISVARIASRRLKLRYLSLLMRQQASAVVFLCYLGPANHPIYMR